MAGALLELDGPSPLQDWITLEVAYHEILGGKPVGPIAVRIGGMLDRKELRFPKEDRAAQALRERLVVTLEYLATRRDADPALAEAYAGLGDTAKAVDAAAGAVVAWGRNQSQRQAALGTLTRVLESAPDLADYMRIFEREVEESGLENPTVRRTLGKALMAKNKDTAALRQFEMAIEVSRWDPGLWDAVVEIHKRGGRFTEAAAARLGACRARPVEFACWGEAAVLFAKAGDDAAAERARTNIVESAPDEADAHEALARALQDEGRWLDAMGRWGQVTRLRKGTPGGWLGMAGAAVEAKIWDKAERAVDHILSRTWPPMFEGIINDARSLKRTIDSR